MKQNTHLFADRLLLGGGGGTQVISFISLTQISPSKLKYPSNEFEKLTRQNARHLICKTETVASASEMREAELRK